MANTEGLMYDQDGKLTQDGTYEYVWDGENRLILVEPASSPVNGDKKLEFAYNYMGRRVQKKVYTHNGSQWDLTLERRFVWADWLMLLELDGGTGVPPVIRKYTWGLDLSGTFQDAGGIGGLLAVYDVDDPNDPNDPSGSYVYFHDANGNVGQLIDLFDGSIDAKYEYDPYGGNLLDPDDPNESGPYAAENAIRFSTKYFDAETALGYWGYRYYSPRLGRWLGRDPIEERGGTQMYCFAHNIPSTGIDPLGRRPRWCCTPGEKCSDSVEAKFVPAGLLNPDEVKTAMIVGMTLVAFTAGCEAPCTPAGPGHAIECTAAIGELVGIMKKYNTGSIWTRYECKECKKKRVRLKLPWWAKIIGPDLGWITCTEWNSLGKTEWKRCEVHGGVNHDLYPIGAAGLPDTVLCKMIHKCIARAAEEAQARCGDPCP